MRIVADIDGWRKVLDVNPLHIKTGTVEIGLSKPLSHIIPDRSVIKAEDVSQIVVRLYATGKSVNNMWIFSTD